MSLSKLVIAPYKLESQSATNLSQALTAALNSRVRRLYTDERGTYTSNDRSIILNWGSSSLPDRIFGRGKVVNNPAAVKVAGNKLSTFNTLANVEGVTIPVFTTDREQAITWCEEGKTVVARTKLNGHSGAGIILAARAEDVPENCPLFVQYVKKAKEFRVHVAFGEVIDVQAKRKRTEFEGEVDYAIRNHQNGWVYCRENIEEPEGLREQAVKAVAGLNLDFGAVDIIYNQHYNKCYVLEINTAPGLEGTSVEIYKKVMLKNLMGVEV